MKISDRTDSIEREAIRLESSFLEILCLVASLCIPDSEDFCHARRNGRAYGSLTARGGGLPGSSYYHVTPLNTTQRHVLVLLGLPDDLYERLANPPTNSNFVLHLRE